MQKRISRRGFLRLLSVLGLMGTIKALTGCVGKEAIETAVPSPVPTASPIPSPSPRPTSTLAPTKTPVVDKDLFSETRLSRVIVAHDPQVKDYPTAAPFNPGQRYPEYPLGEDDLQPQNGAYDLVRQALHLLEPVGFGSPGWNPLHGLIKSGDMVVIKPNFVDPAVWHQGKITHPAVLRPIIDYIYKACGPTGRIIVADAPWALEVFDQLVEVTQTKKMVEHLAERHKVPVFLEDLNKSSKQSTPLIDLGQWSELRKENRKWYDAHGQALRLGGDPGIGSYRIAPTILQADVVVSVPKIKMHCSGGVTLTMKNVLGIIPCWDGPSDEATLKDCAHTSDLDQKGGKRGEYLDNDTIWRSMADLNRIILYADRTGHLQRQQQRRYLTIVDGIIAGESSQYNPHPYPLSTIVIGFDPVTVDAVTARTMGFDHRLIKSVAKASISKDFPLGTADAADIKVIVSGEKTLNDIYRRALTPETQVYPWTGHIEAADFDGPKILSYTWGGQSSELVVKAEDLSGVACVRAAYIYQEEKRMKNLVLSAGNRQVGEWRVPFPLGQQIKEITLIAVDELFNMTTRVVNL